MVADVVMAHRAIGKLKKLLFQIVGEVICTDLEKLTRECNSATLWAEADRIRAKRNEVLHRACNVSRDEANECLEVAAYVLESLFPRFLDRLELALDGNSDIRPKSQVQHEEFIE